MKVYAGVPREDYDLIYGLRGRCQSKLLFNSTLFEMGEFNWMDKSVSFAIPNILLEEKSLDFFIMCGDGQERDFCWLYYGINGEKLFPLHFSNKKKLIVYLAEKGVHSFIFSYDETFTLYQFVLRKKKNTIVVYRKLKWYGHVGEIVPETFWKLEPMICSAFKAYRTKDLAPPIRDEYIEESNRNEKSDGGEGLIR